MTTIPEISIATSDEEVAAAIEIRRAVFVAEQRGPADEEPDARDAEARHYLIRAQGRVVGAARSMPDGLGAVGIGRVCVSRTARGMGWGTALVEYVIADARRRGARDVVLDAQVPAVPFYERLGFAAEGPVFQDAGIPHRRVRRRLE